MVVAVPGKGGILVAGQCRHRGHGGGESALDDFPAFELSGLKAEAEIPDRLKLIVGE